MASSERRAQRAQNRHTKADEQALQNGLAHCLETFEGRRFLWFMLAQAGIFRGAFNGNALETAFNCGKQEIGRWTLQRIIDVNPEAYITMMRDNQALLAKREAELEAILKGEDQDEDDV